MALKQKFWSLLLALLLVGCTATGKLGIVTKPTAEAGPLLKEGRAFQEIGSVEGSACRHTLVVVPVGDDTFPAAVKEALAQKGGDALLHVTVTNSRYNFVVYALDCTTVQGTAIKF
ncbi:MAG: hypothetical protein AB1411_11780 [Nitrospirota bacterium]